MFNHFGTVSAIVAMFVFLALAILYPNDRLSGFAMATKTCRAAKLYQRPLNSMRSLSVLDRSLKVSIFGDKRLVPKKSPDIYTIYIQYIDTTTDHITPCCACSRGVINCVQTKFLSCHFLALGQFYAKSNHSMERSDILLYENHLSFVHGDPIYWA